jgi:RHS repeat-associated protein
MKLAVRRIAISVSCCAGLLCSAAEMSEAYSLAPDGSTFSTSVVPSVGSSTTAGGTAASSSLGGSLVIFGSPVEGEELKAEREAKLTNPQTLAERAASRTKFENLDDDQARQEVAAAFPYLVTEPAGGPPRLPAGQNITGYLGDNVARVDLGEGKRGVIESTEAMAVGTSPGHLAPLDLTPKSVGGVFEPTTSLVSVKIPRRLSQGVSVGNTGVSLTPTNTKGVALGGSEGRLDGDTVFFGGTGVDTGVVVKPTYGGFDEDTLLFSERSATTLSFRVGLPEGASLVHRKVSGGVRVVKDGVTLAVIPRPVANDAEGAVVPVRMSVVGNILTLSVDSNSVKPAYPIDVDPEVWDFASPAMEEGVPEPPSNFHFIHEGAQFTASETGKGASWRWTEHITGSHQKGEYGALAYTTQGDSYISAISVYGAWDEPKVHLENLLEIASPSKVAENQLVLPEESSPRDGYSIDVPKKEGEPRPSSENSAEYLTESNEKGAAGENVIESADVEIKQETSPEGHFNTTSPTVDGQPNILYGTSNWLAPKSGAAELTLEDKGVGVSSWSAADNESVSLGGQNLLSEDLCAGIQCPEKLTRYLTYKSGLPNGESTLRLYGYNSFGSTNSEAEGLRTHKIKVDDTPPHSIVLTGLPSGNEIGAGEYHLKAEATDGEGSTPSPGIRSISLSIDGKELGSASGSCEPGPCTAKSAEWTITGRDYAVGRHTITVTATDNAGNVAVENVVVTVRAASSVALSPGSLNLESGEFALGATDVSMGSGLTVSRSYGSRHLNAGAEGPVGSQWAISLTGQEQLEEQPNESVVFTESGGSQDIFRSKSKGVFEAPPGDSNLALTEGEVEGKKAYILANAASDTKTVFTLPSGGSDIWVPTKQEGPVATDTATYKYQTTEGQTEYGLPSGSSPAGIVAGPDGNLWFADYSTSKLGKITTSGSVTEYSLPSGSDPLSVAAGPDGNVWFTNVGTSKIGKITTSGTITEYALPSGSAPYTITQGSDGNLWYTDFSTSKIGKITTSGAITEYSLPAGSRPYGIAAGPEGNQWFTDWGTNKVGKITASGAVTEYSLPSGSDPHRIVAGSDGNLWLPNTGTNKIAKVTTSGAITEYSVPSGSELETIALGPEGNLWFTDELTGKIGRITTAGAITEYSVPSGGGPYGIAAGPDGNLWFTEIGTSKIGKIPTAGTVIEPTQALAPEPAGVSCAWKEKPTEMKPGCRALEFKYASETTAKGEAESEWGEYRRRLTKVLAVAYNPSTKIMEEKAVAEYSYDKLGRLRAEWDPRISPSLKTIYGYDAEGHVTALTEPGQASWAFTYGTITGDANAGRLLKVTRAPASAKLWKGELPENKEAPKLSGSAVTGATMSVSIGAWGNEPVAYTYQWDDCNAEGADCAGILGATNADYTLAGGDVGHTVIAQVTATNGGGSVSVATSASTSVKPEIAEYGLPSGSSPTGIVAGPDGNLWFADYHTSKVGKVTTAGAVTEYSLPSGSGPLAIAAGSDKNLWFTDVGTSKIGKVTTAGVVTEYALPSGSDPYTIAAGPDGNLWYTNFSTSKIGKITTAGVITEYALPSGSDPYGIAAGPDGNLWFTDWGTSKIGKITTSGVITEYGLPSGSDPRRITSGSDGNLWVTNTGTNKIAKVTTSGAVTEYSVPSGSELETIAGGAEGNLWFTDELTGKIGRITTSGAITEYSVPSGSGSDPYGIAAGPDGNLWLTEIGTSKIAKAILNPAEGAHGTPQPGSTVEYDVPVSGSGAPHNMSESEVAKWGQKDEPAEATSIFPPDEAQSWPASSYKRATTYYLDAKGRTVNVANPSGGISTSEYNENNDAMRSLTADNRAAALAEGSKSSEVAKLLSTESKYNGETKEEREKEEREKEEKEAGGSAPGTMLLETLGPQHLVRLVHGKTKENEEVQARNHTVYYYDEGAPSEGGPYRLVTKVTQGAQVNREADRDVRTITDSYSGQENLGWKLRAPTSVTASPAGLKLTHTTVYESSTGNVVETRGPASSGEGNTHDAKTIYYTAAENKSYTSCGEHPQWANLPCESLPGKQPEPALPITTVTYNIWGEPEITTRTVGSATRTTTNVYDGAGRLTSTHATSTTGTALPTVNEKYSEMTGQLIEQSTTTGSETQTITSKYNALGQLLKYTDANGNTTEYEYEPEKDGRLTHVNDGKGTQAYTYEEATGALTKLVDTQGTNVLTFTASHDVEGNMTSQGYPNGMTASYIRNPAGETTGLTYEKKTHCSEKCIWFTEALTPSIHDQTLEQVSSLAKTSDTYDEAGRLTQLQETPTGEGCTTRLYEYEEESNRTKLTTRSPGTGGLCAAEGGTAQTHTYDDANRLTDTGVTYDTFGDITKLPAADAAGSELQSTFYADGQLDEQKQGEQTIGYQLDPDGRILETVDTGTVNSTYENHYAGPGDAPSWTIEPTSGHWKRYVSGIGGFAAIETDTTEPELQLTDLRGDVVARASVSETATKLLSTERPTEYGVPTTSKPEKYSWLGGDLLPTELPSGVVAMGARSYVPEIGRFLQPDPVPGGTDNPYAYTDGDPVNETDLTGMFIEGAYLYAFNQEENARSTEREAAREQAAREEAERKAAEAAAIAAMEARMAAEQAATYAQDRWDAEAKEFGEDNIAGGGMAEESDGSGGFSQFFRIHADPGTTPGSSCEGSVDSKKYKKEHKKLCHEIESNPWEPAEAFCWLFTSPACDIAEKIKQVNER